ncbi:SpaH/EbpB family LPXTG-anchored major pilin [Floccifex sp.]|uniref:SpaH/EbpB family LPXTG-anchored major pilin n=1 Tax=Floccifex sp. TaxID=2815810 RepID=UPI003EFC1517
MKKLLGILCSFMLVLGMNVTPAFAEETTYSITINNSTEGHTYEAYQIFTGDLLEKKDNEGNVTDRILSNVTWGSGVNGEKTLTALKALENSPYDSCSTAEDVADKLATFSDDSTELDAFAKVVGTNLSLTVAGSTSTVTNSKYEISGLAAGYYLIKDKDDSLNNKDDVATKFILRVVGNVEANPKSNKPSIDKVIVNADTSNGKGTAQDVGSVVQFKLTSKVPAMDGYDTYTYIVNDKMSAGLTFNNNVAVTIGGTSYTDFEVTQNGQSFTITFNNFINQKSNAGKDIVITYSATINESALTTDKETNTVNLEYSNNPNDSTSKGKTPDKVVYVYDFDIVIDKYTVNETTEIRLAGAKFVLYKTVDSKNLYYFCDKTSKEVNWVELVDDAVAAAIKEGTITEVTTDSNGAAKFQGLDSGTYYLHETEAPAGYNLLKEDVTVTINATYGEDGQITSSSATSTNNGQYQQTQGIINKAGAELPSTGGMGTTLFYVAGAGLVLVAVVLLITRKRMN